MSIQKKAAWLYLPITSPKAVHVALNSERSKAKERPRYVLLCCACGLVKAVTAPQKKLSPSAADVALCLHLSVNIRGLLCYIFTEFTILQPWSPPTLEFLLFNLHQVFLQLFDLCGLVLCCFGSSGKAWQDFIRKLKMVSRIFGFKAITGTVLLNFWVAPGSEPSCSRHPMVHYCLFPVN